MAGGDSHVLSSGFADYETNRDRLTLRSSRTQSKTGRLLILRGCRRCDDGWHWYARQERERPGPSPRQRRETVALGRRRDGARCIRRSWLMGGNIVATSLTVGRRQVPLRWRGEIKRRLSTCLVFSGPTAASQQNPADPISRDLYRTIIITRNRWSHGFFESDKHGI